MRKKTIWYNSKIHIYYDNICILELYQIVLFKSFLIEQMRDEDVLFHFSLYSLVFRTVPGIGEKDKEEEREEWWDTV